MPSWSIEGARWVIMLTFLLSTIEKLRTLASRSANWHPMMLATAWRHKHATSLLSVFLGLDFLVVALSTVRPVAAGMLAASLIGVYSWAALRPQREAPGSTGCRCLAVWLNARTHAGLVARNSVLIMLAALAIGSRGLVRLTFLPFGFLLIFAVGVQTVLVDKAVVHREAETATTRSAFVAGEGR